MRKAAPNFKVEVKRSRRPTRGNAFSGDGNTDVLAQDPLYEDFPVRDVNEDTEADDFDKIRLAEERLFGRSDDEYPEAQPRPVKDRFREADEALFGKKKTAPAPEPEPEPAIEAAPEPKPAPAAEAPRKPRILKSILATPDPVQERLQAEAAQREKEEQEERQQRQERRERVRQARAATPRRKRVFVQAEPEMVIPTPQPVAAASPHRIALPVRAHPRHATPRILYNPWNQEVFKREARHVPRDTAQVILTPGNRWKRRLPVDCW